MADAHVRIRATDNTKAAFASVNKNLALMQATASRLNTVLNLSYALLAVRGVSSLLKWAEGLEKSSKHLGISTDALQELHYAAQQSDVDTAKLSSGLEKFSVQLGQLRAGAGKLSDEGLGKLDAGFVQLLKNTKNNDEAIAVATKRISEYRSEQDKAAVSALLFGKGSSEMHLLVKGGTAELARLREEAHKLGAVLSNETIKNADAVNDEFSKLGSILRVQLLESLSAILPQLREMVKRVAENKEGLQGFFKVIAGSLNIVIEFAAALGKAADGIKALLIVPFIKSFEEDFRAVSNQMELVATQIRAIQQLRIPAEELISQKMEEQKKLGEQQVEISQKINALRSRVAGDVPTIRIESPQVEPPKGNRSVADQGLKEYYRLLTEELNKFNEGLSSSMEALANAKLLSLGSLAEFYEAGLVSDAEYNAKAEELERQHQEKLTELVKSGAIQRRDLDKLTVMQQTRFYLGELGRMLDGASQHSRAFFNMNKAVRIATATMDMYAGAQKAWAMFGPFGAPAAALVIAAGLVNIRAIARQNFGGGSSGGGSSGGSGSAPSGIGSPSDLGSTSEPAKVRDIPTAILNVGDDMLMNGTGLRNLIEKINEQYPDGVKIKVA